MMHRLVPVARYSLRRRPEGPLTAAGTKSIAPAVNENSIMEVPRISARDPL